MKLTTEQQVRLAFWRACYPNMPPKLALKVRQNSWDATVRSAWVDYVDMLQKDGVISEKLAERVTL